MQNCQEQIVSKPSNNVLRQDNSFITEEAAADVMSLEFSSFTSTVTYSILLSKFGSCDLGENIIGWIQTYLENFARTVISNGFYLKGRMCCVVFGRCLCWIKYFHV